MISLYRTYAVVIDASLNCFGWLIIERGGESNDCRVLASLSSWEFWILNENVRDDFRLMQSESSKWQSNELFSVRLDIACANTAKGFQFSTFFLTMFDETIKLLLKTFFSFTRKEKQWNNSFSPSNDSGVYERLIALSHT